MPCSRTPKCRLRPALFGFEISRAADQRFGRASQIARTANQPGIMRRNGVQHFSGCFPCGHAFCVRGEIRQIRIPPFRQSVRLHLIDFSRKIGVKLTVFGKSGIPVRTQFTSPFAQLRIETLAHAFRYQEFRVFGPAVEPLRQGNFGFAKRFAMRRCGVLFVWRTVGDMAVYDDERGRLPVLAEAIDGR